MGSGHDIYDGSERQIGVIEDSGEVRVELAPPLATFTIRRPHVHNALDLDSIEALGRLVNTLERRPDIQVLIIDSEGTQSFIAGGDIRQFDTLRGITAGRALASQMGDILLRLEMLTQIVIAAIDGDAYGGGVELALACDLRIMERSAKLGFTQARFGLTSGWGGSLRLVELVGYNRALDAMVNTRVLDAETCERWGLVNHLVDEGLAAAAATAMANRLVGLGHETLRGIKRVVRAGQLLPRADAIAEEREVFSRLWASQHHEARVARFLERKARSQTDIDHQGEG